MYVRAFSHRVTSITAGYDYGAKWGTTPAGFTPASTTASLAALPPVGRLGLTSPRSSVLCSAKTAAMSFSGRFACRSLPDTLPTSVCSWCPSRAHDLVEVPRPHQGLWSPGPPLREFDKETRGSPKFPSSPCEDMPRSQTPVVSCALAKAHPGLLPSGH